MTPKTLVLIRSNPKESHRACEGIRIALGLAAGEHAVEVVLAGEAALLLTPDAEESVDGEMAVKFLASLKEFIPHFFVEKENARLIDLSDSEYSIISLSSDEVAEKIADASRFAVF